MAKVERDCGRLDISLDLKCRVQNNTLVVNFWGK